MIETLGYVSALLLGWCGVPQAIHSVRSGNASGVSKAFLWMWLLGEIGMIVYTLFRFGVDIPLMLNYTLNVVIICVIMKYSYFPRT